MCYCNKKDDLWAERNVPELSRNDRQSGRIRAQTLAIPSSGQRGGKSGRHCTAGGRCHSEWRGELLTHTLAELKNCATSLPRQGDSFLQSSSTVLAQHCCNFWVICDTVVLWLWGAQSTCLWCNELFLWQSDRRSGGSSANLWGTMETEPTWKMQQSTFAMGTSTTKDCAPRGIMSLTNLPEPIREAIREPLTIWIWMHCPLVMLWAGQKGEQSCGFLGKPGEISSCGSPLLRVKLVKLSLWQSIKGVTLWNNNVKAPFLLFGNIFVPQCTHKSSYVAAFHPVFWSVWPFEVSVRPETCLK
jgi:hypothetical protein